MVFRGGILGGARKIWGNPYLNSMTVLFDDVSAYPKSHGLSVFNYRGISEVKGDCWVGYD